MSAFARFVHQPSGQIVWVKKAAVVTVMVAGKGRSEVESTDVGFDNGYSFVVAGSPEDVLAKLEEP